MIALETSKIGRTLFGFRQLIGGLLLWEALSLGAPFKIHFDPDLLFTRDSLQEFWAGQLPWILEALPPPFSNPLLSITLVALSGVLLLLNRAPRFAAGVAFLALWLLQFSQPWVSGGADTLLKLICFWIALSPVPLPAMHPQVTGDLGDYGIPLQLATMYFMGGLLKNDISWTAVPSAIQMVLASPEFSRIPLETHPPLLTHLLLGASRAVRALELAAPLLILFGLASKRWRGRVAGLFICFHLALAAFLKLGLFPWLCIAAWIHFAKTEWHRPRLQALRQPRQLVALMGMSVTLLINADIARTAVSGAPPAQVISRIGDATGLSQFWNLFTPGPPEDAGMLKIETWENEDISERVNSRLGLPAHALDLRTAPPHFRKALRHIVNGDSVVLVKRLCELGCAARQTPPLGDGGVRLVHVSTDLRTRQKQTRTLWEMNCP